MKYSEDQIVGQITSNLSTDSSMPAKQNAGAAYANWFYANHNHGVENQRTCISKIASVLGLDFDTALRIQAPILSAYSAAYNIGIANEAIFSQHAQVSRQISNHLVDKAVQHSREAEQVAQAKAAQEAQAAKAQAAQEAQQAAQAVQEALQKAKASQAQYEYETKVAEMLQQTRAAATVSQMPLAEASKPRMTTSEAWAMVQKATVSFNKADEDQIKNNQAAIKWKDPSILAQSPIWQMMDQQSRDLAARNYNVVLHNQGVFARAYTIQKTLYEYSRKVYELAQEDEYNVVPTGIKFKRSDVDTAERSVVIAQKFISLYKEKAEAFDVFKTQPAMVANSHAMAGYWGYTERARQKLKDSVLDHVKWEEWDATQKDNSVKIIGSFATDKKEWALLNKPSDQTEINWFWNNMCWFPKTDYTTITKLNLSNSCMDDSSAYHIAQYLSTDKRVSNLKYLDVTGNKITVTGEGYFVKALQNKAVEYLQILLHKLIDVKSIQGGVKKQSDLFAGSKEERQKVIHEYFDRAKGNGADIENITVSKSIFQAMANSAKLSTSFVIGLVKCNIIPDSATSFVKERIIEKASKKAGLVNIALEAVTCYFETFDEHASSKEGVQFMHDIGLVGIGEFIEHVE